jgi:hypothetical protein
MVLVVTTAGGLAVTPGIASAAGPTAIYTAVFEPDQVRHIWINNVGFDAYATGLQATAVDDPSHICVTSINRTWWERETSGEREFHLEIEGDSSERCQVTVWRAPLTMYRTGSVGDLAPGQSVTQHWNNAAFASKVYAVGVVPSQPASGTCKMEVTTEFRTQPDGEHEFAYRTTNIGDVTCSAQLRHVALGVTWKWVVEGTMDPGNGYGLHPGDYAPGTKVHVVNAAPTRHVGGVCRWSHGPIQFINDHFYGVSFTNIGAVRCGITGTFSGM